MHYETDMAAKARAQMVGAALNGPIGGASTAKVPAPMSPADEAFGALHAEINDGQQIVARLEDRLRAVMRPTPTAPDGNGIAQGIQVGSPLVVGIHEARIRLRSTHARIADLLGALEI